MIEKGLIYARRSSETGDDYSLDTQIAACRAYADAHGLDIVEAVRENVTGTKHMSEREQGAEVWKKIQAREITTVVVYTIDRLSRAKLRHALTLIDEILEAGVRLHVIDAGEITSTDDIGTIIRSWQAGEERKKIVDRLMRANMRQAADRLAALEVERVKLSDLQAAAESRSAARKNFESRMARLRPRLLVANEEQRAQALDVIDLAVTLVEVEKRSVRITITSEIAPPDEIEVPRTLPRGRKPR